MVKPSANALQVVVGTNADQVAGEMKVALRATAGGAKGVPGAATSPSAATGATSSATGANRAVTSATSSATGASRAATGATNAATSATNASAAASSAAAGATRAPVPPPIPTPTLTSLLAALGGRTNVRAIEAASSRLRINIADASNVDQKAIAALGLRGVALAAPNWVHVIIGPEASTAGVSLRQLLT